MTLLLLQVATIAVFSATVVDPNVGLPARPPVSYAVPLCKQPKAVETLPIVNPLFMSYDDPANPLLDCTVDLQAQLVALPLATYRAAVKVGTETRYGPLSTSFAMQAHPCDAAPITQTVTAGQPFTLGWCHPGLNVTDWRLYRDKTPLTGVTVSAGSTANAAGLRYYTTSRTEPVVAAAVAYEVSALNGTAEGARTVIPQIAVLAPPPATPSLGRVTVP